MFAAKWLIYNEFPKKNVHFLGGTRIYKKSFSLQKIIQDGGANLLKEFLRRYSEFLKTSNDKMLSKDHLFLLKELFQNCGYFQDGV
jgi:hypothetical protein